MRWLIVLLLDALFGRADVAFREDLQPVRPWPDTRG